MSTREPRTFWEWAYEVSGLVLALLILSALAYALLGCAAPVVERSDQSRLIPANTCPVTHVTLEVRIPCMDPLPFVVLPTWPAPDSVGNVLMHESTMVATRAAITTWRHYSLRQYARCAMEAGEGMP